MYLARPTEDLGIYFILVSYLATSIVDTQRVHRVSGCLTDIKPEFSCSGPVNQLTEFVSVLQPLLLLFFKQMLTHWQTLHTLTCDLYVLFFQD